MWPTDRLQKLFDIEHPVLQAPLAGASTPAMAIAVANAGGMGALGCAMMSAEQLRAAAGEVAAGTTRAVNFNFFVHEEPDLAKHAAEPMHEALKPYYADYGLGEATVNELAAPFDMSQPSISRHLKVLEEGGLIEVGARTAQFRPRRLKTEALARARSWMDQLWGESFDRLDAFLAETSADKPRARAKNKAKGKSHRKCS